MNSESLHMSGTNGNSIERLVRILSEKGPMRAGDLGFEIWGTKAQRCKCENVQATMFIRPATKLLYRAESLGLVRWREEHGKYRIWYAVIGGNKTMRKWECFCDECYFGLWAVRPVGENRWGHCFHVQTQQEGEGLRDLLNELQYKANAANEPRGERG